MRLGDRIKLARNRLGLSQAQLAKAVGTAQPVISQLENGRQQTSGILVQIANALKVRPLWLASGTGPMEASPEDAADDHYLPQVLEAWPMLTLEQRKWFAKMVKSAPD